MTSIPVRKGTNLNRRSHSGVTLESHTVRTDGPPQHGDKKRKPSHENKENARTFSMQSSKKDILDENTRLQSQLTVHVNKLKQMETALKSAQSDVVKKSSEAAQIKERCENTLLYCNIDPVTLERVTTEEEEDEMALKKTRDKTQETVSLLQNKLDMMKSQSNNYLKQLKIMCSELDQITEDSATSDMSSACNDAAQEHPAVEGAT